jgi:hypothetical protein
MDQPPLSLLASAINRARAHGVYSPIELSRYPIDQRRHENAFSTRIRIARLTVPTYRNAQWDNSIASEPNASGVKHICNEKRLR